MNSFDLGQGSMLGRAREIFTEIEDAEALLYAVATGPKKRRIAASHVYAMAQGATDPEIEILLRKNRAARSLYRQAVADTARFTLPEARAASSGNPPARLGEGCHIRVERSRAEPDQFFVVVQLPKETSERTRPTSLVVCDSEDYCQSFPLPAVRDGIAQIIADTGSDLMRLISDPTTRVYLR
jgi:hypothetical protein